MPSCEAVTSRPPRGFSFIELLLVVAVSGIMMSVVLPRLRISESTEVQLAGMQLAQDIDLARTRALSTRSRARVKFTTTSAVGYAGYLDVDGDSAFAESADEITGLRGFGTRALPVRILFGRGNAIALPNFAGSGAVTFSSNRLEFDARGLPTPMGTAGVAYLAHERDPNAVTAIAVSSSGGVRIWTWKAGIWK